jgi:NADPH:quinone reductase
MRVNRQITLVARPVGYPKISDFSLTYSPLRSPAEGEVLVRSVYLSLDPFTRLRMNAVNGAERPVALGEVVVGRAVALVVESRHPEFRIGDAVEGMLGWQEGAVCPGRELRKLDLQGAPISSALGVLGLPGLTAYFGLLDVGAPAAGETVVVSAAAGGVGMIVGQIAKLKSCLVVGVASSKAEVSWLRDELGFDAPINFRSPKQLDRQLAAHCPDGIDVYFDNVGGETTDAVIRRINPRARIVVCGQLSQYNLERPEKGPRWLDELIVKRARAEGFQVAGFAGRFPAARRKLARWLREGRLKYREEISHGLESVPQAFLGMLHGNNVGKQLVQLSEPVASAA